MQVDAGVGLIVAGTGLGLFVGFGLWSRVPARTAYVAVSVLGAVVGTGAMLLQQDPGPADWVVALGMLVAFTPVHCRFVFGEPGRST